MLVVLLLFFISVLLAMLYWPRTYYKNLDPFRNREDYWIPFSSGHGPLFSRGPRPWRRWKRLFQTPESYRKSDAGLEDALIHSLRELGLPWRNIAVRASQGKLKLFGLLNSREEKKAVEELASKVAGVGKVKSNLQVLPPLEFSINSEKGTIPARKGSSDSSMSKSA